jgi:hypothetical protein
MTTTAKAGEQAVQMVQAAGLKVGVILIVAIVLIAIFKPKMRKFKAERRERERKEAKLRADVKRAMNKNA